MSLMVPSYMMPEQLRLARVQLCVGLFLFRPAAFSPAAAQPHEQAERKSGRPRKGTAVAVQGTGKSGQCRQADQQIQYLQSRPDVACLTKTSMCRLTKEILQTIVKERNSQRDPWLPRKENSLAELKISAAALAVLSHAAEAYVVQRLVQGNVLAAHRGKKTLTEKDLQTLQTVEEVAAGHVCKKPRTQ
ncbi:unnamed protein product [Durusdinium trenchii]|uniref:Histone H2A/H2B/H3 domain-containing protein n=1 Tax=Durusdinium trenchii TaxID=1381693 RepID=A0ABP0MPK9_9DINO